MRPLVKHEEASMGSITGLGLRCKRHSSDRSHQWRFDQIPVTLNILEPVPDRPPPG